MSLTHEPHGIILPEAADADRVPADLLAMVTSMDSHLLGTAIDEGDMTVKFDTAPVGTVVSLLEKDAIYRKGVGGNWHLVWSWIDNKAFTPSWGDNWSSGGTCTYSQRGTTLDIYVIGTYSGPTKTADSTGSIGDELAFTVPSNLMVSQAKLTTCKVNSSTMGQGIVTSAGNGYIQAVTNGQKLSSGMNVEWSWGGAIA